MNRMVMGLILRLVLRKLWCIAFMCVACVTFSKITVIGYLNILYALRYIVSFYIKDQHYNIYYNLHGILKQIRIGLT